LRLALGERFGERVKESTRELARELARGMLTALLLSADVWQSGAVTLFETSDLHDAVCVVRKYLPPTPQYRWPLLAEATGMEVWVKHENHTPTAAFKVRGGLVLLDGMRAAGHTSTGRNYADQTGPIVTATRGNHGQSLAFAGRSFGIDVVLVVPEGNDPDQNASMRSFGAQVIEHGHDFQAARERSRTLAEELGGTLLPPFHPELVRGVATYAAELFDATGELDAVYVPVGMGSGICGLITVRDLLGLRTEIIGVVAAGAPAYALSFAAGHAISTDTADTFADGVATRSPDPAALPTILAGAADVMQVDDDQIRSALRLMYRATHNVAEGAGAVGLAGLVADPDRHPGGRVGVVLSGGNLSGARLAEILA
jgi:threonine dehydratase